VAAAHFRRALPPLTLAALVAQALITLRQATARRLVPVVVAVAADLPAAELRPRAERAALVASMVVAVHQAARNQQVLLAAPVTAVAVRRASSS